MSALRFEILARSAATGARRGRVTTPHGAFDTPAFMPVGTKAAVKGILPDQVARTGAQVLLNNTFHLMLRPGADLIQRLGGVHGFMGWPAPILTDSGGFQVFSLSDTNRIDDEGVTFRSPVDGSTIRLTPERSIQVQNQLGPDIIMAFDDCPPGPAVAAPDDERHPFRAVPRPEAGREYLARLDQANERTVRWLERCKRAHARDDQALFGIVQGGTDLDRRRWSAERVCAVDLPGYAIGGVAVGESPDAIDTVVRATAPMLPDAKPRYLMGVGYERDILGAVLAGVDMFDCVLPTRNGRNAFAFTPTGPIRLRNQAHAEDPGAIDPGCDCQACGGGFSRAYLRHLFQAEEMLGPILVSLHNLRHFQRLMAEVRAAIDGDGWAGLAGRWPIVAPVLARAV
ncbi:MAG: tRNA guanosine(34) transglycosylase Tgt [Phycisphaerae bacterium]|nr:tRNA guanosine(34) transglycosylase Tgt [Phycisphaerae bacterium]